MAQLKEEYKKEDAVKCPVCGNTHLVMEDRQNKAVQCPKCKKWKLVGFMYMIA